MGFLCLAMPCYALLCMPSRYGVALLVDPVPLDTTSCCQPCHSLHFWKSAFPGSAAATCVSMCIPAAIFVKERHHGAGCADLGAMSAASRARRRWVGWSAARRLPRLKRLLCWAMTCSGPACCTTSASSGLFRTETRSTGTSCSERLQSLHDRPWKNMHACMHACLPGLARHGL